MNRFPSGGLADHVIAKLTHFHVHTVPLRLYPQMTCTPTETFPVSWGPLTGIITETLFIIV